MKRAAMAVAAAAAALALLPGTAAQASAPGGYSVTRIALTSTSRVFVIAVNPATRLVYAGGTVGGQGTVTVIDESSHAVEGSITVPGTPDGIAVDPKTDTVYALSGSGLTVIDGATGKVVTTIQIAPAGGPDGVAVDPSANRVYAATRLTNNAPGVTVIDGGTNSVTTTIALPGTATVESLAVDAATGTVYAAEFDGTLSAIDEATNTVTESAQLGGGRIAGLAVDPAAGSLYAVDEGSNAVDVVSAASLAVTASITGCPQRMTGAAFDPAANLVFVTSYGQTWPSPAGSTCVIDASANTVAETFPRGGYDVAADPDTGAAYIAAWYPGNDIWVAVPSAADEWSPMVYGLGPTISGTSATFVVGHQSSFPLLVSALPTAALTETGALPAGVTMSASGVFSGTPAVGTAGTYPITVTASNGVSPVSTVSLNIIVDIAPSITSPANATFQAGVSGSFTVQATGTPAPTVSASGYPSWMIFTQGSSSGVLSGTPPVGSGGVYSVSIGADNGSGFTASQTLTLTVKPSPSYTPVTPLRILDTRDGTGGYSGPVLAGQTISVQVTGRNGLPSGVTAVALNVTAVNATASSYVAVYPDGKSRPVASNLNFTAGEIIPNLVIVPVGGDGKVDFYNHAGSVDLAADLSGYYTTSGGSWFGATGPVRVLDTRNGTGVPAGKVGPGQTITLKVTGSHGVPAGASAVVLNVTAVNATASSYLTVYPGGAQRPLASNLNFTAGEVFPNLVIVPVSVNGTVSFYNHAGSVDLAADLSGYYTTSGGSYFGATGPMRVLDTRNGTGVPAGKVGPGQTITLKVTGSDGVPAWARAVVLNVTAVNATASSYVTVYPGGGGRAVTSNLNFTAGEVFPNLVIVPLGFNRTVSFYNHSGSVDLVADLSGYYA